MYVVNDGNNLLMIYIYVDDHLITCSSLEKLHITKKKLCENFRMKEFGELNVIMRMESVREHSNRTITFMKYR